MRWFSRRVEPKPGEVWELKAGGDPWPDKFCLVTILDTRPGWVRYSNRIGSDDRMKLHTFLYIYRPSEVTP
jgi:hypothetical protein